jgi:hypothetical protein
MEAQGVSARAAQLAGVQDSKRTNDAHRRRRRVAELEEQAERRRRSRVDG